MKYGLLAYFGSYCNFGDYAQSMAIEYLYVEIMKIPKEQIVYLAVDELKDYSGEQLVLPYSYVLSYLYGEDGKAEVSPNITIVFLGASMITAMIYDAYSLNNFFDPGKGYYELFCKYSPVGCRDDHTKRLLQKHGISAYLQGCITNVFPFREEGVYQKVLLIDVPVEILAHIPECLLKQAEVLCNAGHIGSLSYHQNYQKIKEQYEYYRDNAALIISSRYHVVSPCNAMGIPCIFIQRAIDKYTRDIRLDTIHPEIQVVCNYDFSSVDFQKKVNRSDSFHELKHKTIELAKSRIQTAVALHEDAGYIYNFFKPRIDWFQQIPDLDNSYKTRLSDYIKTYHLNTKGNYYIWGAITFQCDGSSVSLEELIESMNPNLQFAGWIDTFKTGLLAGKEIIHPDRYELGQGDFVIVAAETAANSAMKQFAERGYSAEKYFILSNVMAIQSNIDAMINRESH